MTGEGDNEHQPLLAGTDAESVITEMSYTPPKSLVHALFDRSLLRSEYHSQKFSTRPKPIVLLILVGMTAFSQLMIALSLIDAIIELLCRHHFPDKQSSNLVVGVPDPRCHGTVVSSHYASFASSMLVVSGVAGVLIVPKLSALSDRIGRRPVIIFCLMCTCLSNLLCLLCVRYPSRLPYQLLLLQSFFDGVGGTSASNAMTLAYVADCIRPEIRSTIMAYPDLITGVGVVVGPLLGSFLYKRLGSVAVLVTIALVVDLSALTLVWLFVPESRTLKARRRSRTEYTETLARRSARAATRTRVRRFLDSINIFRPLLSLRFRHLKQYASHRVNAWILVVALGISVELSAGFINVAIVYSEAQFGWTAVENGYLLSAYGATRVFILTVVYPLAIAGLRRVWHISTHRLDLVDTTILRIALAIDVVSVVIIAYAGTGSVFAIGMVCLSTGGMSGPIIKNTIIKYAQRHNVGEVAGALGFVANIGVMTAPLIFFSVYRYTLDTRPFFVFELTSMIFLSLLVLCMFLRPVRDPLDDAAEEEALNEVEND